MDFKEREAVADSAEGRHEGCGDGHAADDRPLLLARLLQDAGEAAEEGDEHIVQRGVGTRQQLGGVLQPQGGKQKIEKRGPNADAHHDKEILQRRPHQLVVVNAKAETKAQDGRHNGRDKHRADDDGDGIDIEPHRSDDDGADEDEDIGPSEMDAAANIVRRPLAVEVVGHVYQPQKTKLKALLRHFAICLIL